ncbi:MAG: FprA family A-type flavoprotein [Dehalococcoidia bacterium]|jgi:flavorubredoxin
MKPRAIADRVLALGAIDWDRRLFDSLIPLPDGTSYNAYLVQGSEKTVLLDAVDPTKREELLAQLDGLPPVDLVVSHHAEQDHSGVLPDVLARYPAAKLVASTKAKGMLLDLLELPEERVVTVEDGEELSLGDKMLRFHYMPYVHWPETMVTFLPQDRILFTCDLFGSHLATSDLYADEAAVYEPAKRYYAEIMMPFRRAIARHLEKVREIDPTIIAPSHGPVYKRPAFIIDAYDDWVSAPPKNRVVLPYITMHGSTGRMVDHLVGALAERGIGVEQFNLAATDIGKLAVSLVDAATIVVATPTVLGGPHPSVLGAVHLAAALNPKLRFAAVIGSYGWGGKAVEQIAALISRADVEILEAVLCRGLPRDADFAALDSLAEAIATRHRSLDLSEDEHGPRPPAFE